MTKRHILIVDDDKNMLKMLRMFLVDDYNVTIVDSGKLALEAVIKKTPDLILLDYEMPVCSGPQMLEMIRSEIKTESVPVIFLTAKGDKESVAKVLSLKPQGYLLKSMPPFQIVESIDNFFASQKAKGL